MIEIRQPPTPLLSLDDSGAVSVIVAWLLRFDVADMSAKRIGWGARPGRPGGRRHAGASVNSRQLLEQLLFALAKGARVGVQLRDTLRWLALGLDLKRPLKQHLRLALGELCGQRVKLRGLGGEQLPDVTREPDVERPDMPVDEQPMLALIVTVAKPVGLEEHAHQRVLAEAQPAAPAPGRGQRAIGDHQLIAKRRPPPREQPASAVVA